MGRSHRKNIPAVCVLSIHLVVMVSFHILHNSPWYAKWLPCLNPVE
uniref:Uncharacterized protein n=1 Tax=Arundo donax TaxID=35708 RepID=A0A0A9F0G1_ARUDO